MNNQPLLLVIDDETIILKTLKEALEDEQYRVETLSDGSKTLDFIGKLIPDLILLDIFMPNVNGLTLLEKIKKEYPQQKVIIISGFGNIPIAIDAIKKGALDFIEKPLNLDEILTKISFLKKEPETENKKEQAQIKNTENLEDYGIIGQSYLFLELIQQINQLANLKFPFLIYGQHGTGKTLLAKYVHQKNHGSLENFFTINCSSFDEENEFGRIENILKNETGTLFLKKIEYLNSEQQKKLLFFLETYEHAQVRIIASCCTPLFNLVTQETFNRSLFNKINIIPIEIPALNKRRYDIPLLVDHFLKNFNKKYTKSVLINTNSLRLLRNHDWQENVTELKFLIEKIVATSPDTTIINPEDLANFLSEKKAQFLEEQSFLRFNSLKEATNEFEKIFLLYLLKKNKYDLKQVSERLNLTPIQLRDKMFRFNIEIKI